jgi:aminoglycoside phosphotransferase (APT) family kinase protein
MCRPTPTTPRSRSSCTRHRRPRARTQRPFCHNDLGIEHVLVDPTTLKITAIIDWTDAAVADPAYDLAHVRAALASAFPR